MLEVAGLSVSYGPAPALWDVSLTVGERELVCVVGPNGAGKTTLINAIAGLHRAASGSLRFKGDDISALASHRRLPITPVAVSTLKSARPSAGT